MLVRVCDDEARHDVICGREAPVANMLSVSSIAHQPDEALAAFSGDQRAAPFARVRPFIAAPYRLLLRHELTWTRLPR